MQSLTGRHLRHGIVGAAPLPCRSALPRVGAKSQRKSTVLVRARYSASGSGYSTGGTPGVVDRVIAAIPYILPYIDAMMYGRYLFYLYPAVKAVAVQPFVPLVVAYQSVPFGSMIAFFGLYIGVVNNRSFSRFVRFNAVQAILLDILLALPRLLESVLTPPTSGWGAQLYINSQSFIWIFITIWVVFGVASSLLGQWARIPFVSDAADQQIR